MDRIRNRSDRNVSIVFTGSDRDAMQDALDRMVSETGMNLHRINVEGFVGEREEQTMGNIREAFDTAFEGGAVLVLDHVDDLFRQVEAQKEEDRPPEEHTEIDYLFKRATSLAGICVLMVEGHEGVRKARNGGVDFIIRF